MPFPETSATAAETRVLQSRSSAREANVCPDTKPGREGAQSTEEYLGLKLQMGSHGTAPANFLLTSFSAIQS